MYIKEEKVEEEEEKKEQADIQMQQIHKNNSEIETQAKTCCPDRGNKTLDQSLEKIIYKINNQ